MDIFERAARRKLRFRIANVEIPVERLFELPLQDKTKPNLDSLAQEVQRELDSAGNVSFVDNKPNPYKAELSLKLDILKHIIDSKKADALAAENRAKKIEQKKQIINILADKESEAYKNMSREDLLKKLEELGGE